MKRSRHQEAQRAAPPWLAHAIKESPLPILPVGSAAIEHTADLQKATFDSGVKTLQAQGCSVDPEPIARHVSQGRQAVHQGVELAFLHDQIQG